MSMINEQLDTLNEILGLCKSLTSDMMHFLICRLQEDLARQTPGRSIDHPGGERKQRDVLTPSQIHKIANYLARKRGKARQFGIDWDTVHVEINDDGSVYAIWQEDQGGPYLQRVPCSEFILRLI